jgi:hypothetical protein
MTKIERLEYKIKILSDALKFYRNPSECKPGGEWECDYPGGISYYDGDNVIIDTGAIASIALRKANI